MDKITEKQNDNQDQEPKKRNVKGFIIKAVLFVVVIYFAGRQLVNNWAEVVQYDWQINPLMLILSVILHLITFVCYQKSWCILMKGFGFDIPLKHGFKVGYLANLGRYIPGKIWQVFGMVYLLKKINVKNEVAFASWGVATMLGYPPAFLIGFVTLYLYPEMLGESFIEKFGLGVLLAIILTIIISVLLIVVPDKTMALYNWMVKKLGRAPIEFKLNKKIAFQVYFGYFISWIFYGLAFYTFINSITVNPEVPLISGIGAFVTAYAVGYFAIFAPGGLGVRELILTTILVPYLGAVATGVAYAARIWNLVVEFIAAGIAYLIKMEKE